MYSNTSPFHGSLVSDAPIYQIDTDLLWSIIKLNTDMFTTNDALKSTRNYSQVCRSWRQFILQSSSLWGKLIDLDDLLDSADLWRNEVLRRSGTSLLWVKGNIHGVPPHQSDTLPDFFFSILNNHWDRIQKLDIYISHSTTEDELHNWSAIYHPAPHLQAFRLRQSISVKSEFLSTSLPLFGDYAPSLHTFDARLAFFLRVPRLPSLRVVCLGLKLTLPEVLDGLRGMRLLESLEIMGFSYADPRTNTTISIDQQTESVHLPNLTRLSLRTGLWASLRVLAYLQLPPGCSLAIQPNPGSSAVPVDGLISNQSNSLLVLSKFAQNYFQSHQRKELWVESTAAKFMFSDYNPTIIYPPIPSFSIVIVNSIMMHETARLLFGTLSVSHFGSVTHLDLIMTWRYRLDTFMEFVSAFTSVDNITSSTKTLKYLFESQQHAPDIFFPRLRVIKLKGQHNHLDVVTCLLPFLESRHAAGYPLDVLDLTNYRWPDPSKPMEERLREVANLTITWPRG